MESNPKQEVAQRLRNSSSVLVTVSTNPSVDQLASAIGLSLMLEKLDKHTTSVFSGTIPNVLEFLHPEKTFDDTVDGLRDFIISLDKEKADKLHYKVEDDAVRIYITPYKSSISQRDLQFSQGDFNVDLVVALGVHASEDLDKAITAHGRILHDASIVTINAGANTGDGNNMGAVDWTEGSASSLAEMLVSISEALEGGLMDTAISTAFLTGIVAATDRFKNELTSPKVMTMAAQLMAAGANQQLIATNLQANGRSGSNRSNSKDSTDSGKIPKNKDNKKRNRNRGGNDALNQQSDGRQRQDDSRSKARPVENDDTLSDIEQVVRAKHNDLDERGRTQRQDGEDPAIKALESELALDDSTNLIDLEGRLKQGPNAQRKRERRSPRESQDAFDDEMSGATRASDSPIADVKFNDRQADDGPNRPSLGGTFNATSQQAHEAREEDMRKSFNREVLSHKQVNPMDAQVPETPEQLRPEAQAISQGSSTGGLPAQNPVPADLAAEINKNDMPDSASLMHDLEEARRAVEEAMDEAQFAGARQPSQYNPNQSPPAGSDLGDMNLPQMPPQGGYGVQPATGASGALGFARAASEQDAITTQQQMQQLNDTTLPRVEPHQPALPPKQDIHASPLNNSINAAGIGQKGAQPPMVNPLYSNPAPFNAAPPMNQQFGPGGSSIPPPNQVAPPPMPPSQPPPMPPMQ